MGWLEVKKKEKDKTSTKQQGDANPKNDGGVFQYEPIDSWTSPS